MKDFLSSVWAFILTHDVKIYAALNGMDLYGRGRGWVQPIWVGCILVGFGILAGFNQQIKYNAACRVSLEAETLRNTWRPAGPAIPPTTGTPNLNYAADTGQPSSPK